MSNSKKNNIGPEPDSELRTWLKQLQTETPSDQLIDQTMDRVFSIARERRSRRHPLRLARRTAALSSVLIAVFLAWLGWADVPQAMLDSAPTSSPLRFLLILVGSGLLLYQMDIWLQLMRRKTHKQ